ncbi:glycosyl transferase [Psychrobacter aquaticus]|uniref:Glycosyltransferase n=1 Tax=Psychrobacter aquaticus CMS 56 TaxID=1354303 RepID=U4T2E1_9GAMM|nr:glycosyl transferase [Psychrobacter aquaticus]ERL54685.1 Glycosyltransferase [Psychrobacter aquaticus CMS 56]
MQHHGEKKIDIVIAWVDGASPTLKLKREQYKSTESTASDAIASTRFASNDEIYYNIASIIKYVPFCRYIYIVTDQQQPEFISEFATQNICPENKIRIVDHKDIFTGYETFLPTFNTRSIETMLWNIPKLSDYFIYMNDDFFFNQPANIEDFLDEDNIIIHGHWRKNIILHAKLKYRQSLQKLSGKPVQPKHTIAQMLSAKILGMNQFFEIHHYPHIADKNILKNYLLNNPNFLTEQIKYKFRDVAQINPITLMNHLKIQKNEVHLEPDIAINYLKNEKSVTHFVTALEDVTIKYGCIQSLDLLEPNLRKRISQAMNHKLAAYLPKSVIENTNQLN